MKIIRCFVENFGVLSKESFDFENGLTSVYKENGRGKTTLFVFIKAMLWGLEASTRRNLDENERNKYRPWNGARYGGWLEFSSDSLKKSYRVTRFFGEKESLDTFEIIELSTGLDASGDFESASIGFALFGIDSEGFERTLFLSERNIEIKNSGSITQKISALASGDDDSYENAIKILDNKRKYYKNNQGRGLITDLEENLRKKRADLDDLMGKSESIERSKAQLEQIDREVQRLNVQKQELEKRAVQLSDALVFKSAQKSINSLEKRLEALENTRNQTLERYNSATLTEQNVQLLHGNIENLKTLLAQNQSLGASSIKDQMGELESKISAASITKDEIPALIEQYSSAKNTDVVATKRRFESLKREYDSIKNTLGATRVDRDDVEQAKQIKDDISNISANKNKLVERHLEHSRNFASPNNQNADKNAFLSLMFALLAALSAVFAVVLTPWLWALCIVTLGASVFCALAYFKNRKALNLENQNELAQRAELDARIDDVNEQIRDLEGQLAKIFAKYGKNSLDELVALVAATDRCTELEREYNELLGKYNAEISQVNKINEQISQKLAGYAAGFEGVDLGQILLCLSRDLERYDYLKNTLKEQNEQKNIRTLEINEAKARLSNCVNSIFASEQAVLDLWVCEQLYSAMMLDLSALPKLENDISELKTQIESAKSQNSASILDQDIDKDESELSFEQAELKVKLTDTNDMIQERLLTSARIDSALEALYLACDDIPMIEQEIDELTVKLESANSEFATVVKTADYLEKAKNMLMSRYLGAICDNFEGIFCDITKGESGLVKLDSKLALKFERDGAYRDIQYFSRGLRDIMDFALRVALIKTIFANEEAPFILLDDPFASLDEKHLAVAKQCVLKISEQYQIIYTVCDHGREI